MASETINIELTPRAAEEIRLVIAQQELDPSTTAVRVDVAPGRPGQPGSGYLLDLVPDWSDEDDEVGESQGLRIVCRRQSTGRLNGMRIDFRDEATGRGFVFERPSEPRDAAEVEGAAPPNEADVRAAMKHVIDPEVGLNVVDLGLVYSVQVEDRHVHLTMTMTTPACPLSEHIKQDAKQSVLAACPGAVDVGIELVWDPPWGPHMMSQEAKKQMGWSKA
ncbi:MAG: iron-sulfur cluster assembly protein [bacterium]